MRLARKLTLALVLGILAVVGVFDYRLVEDNTHAVEAHLSDNLALIARGLGLALPELVRVSGPASAARLVAARNGERSARVRWVRLDAKPGTAQWADLDAARVAALAADGDVRVLRDRGGAGERLAVYRAFQGQRPLRDVVEVSESLTPLRQQERRSLVGILVKSLFIVVSGSAFALALGTHFIGRPIRLLVEQARRVGAGDLSRRLILSQRRDELTELAREMNEMCDRLLAARGQVEAASASKLAAIEQLRHADRLKTVGQLASGIAHELGTPLNVVSGYAQMIASGDTNAEEARAVARIIAEQTARITVIIRQLLDFARRAPPTLARGDLAQVAERTVRMLSHLAAQRNVRLQLASAAGSAMVTMDGAQIEQALTNLVLNGIQAMPSGGELYIGVEHQHAQPPSGSAAEAGDYYRVAVRDQGIGMPPEVLARVFEPFFTSKAAGEGTGLGLSVSYGIVQDHGGWISAASAVGRGSCFALFLPAARA